MVSATARLLPLVILALSSSALANPTAEYRIKAAYIFNFLKFVEWPATSFAAEQAPYVIGVIGKDPFGDILEQTFADKKVGNRGIRILRFEGKESLEACHVLFVSSEARDSPAAILEAAKRHATLTISDLEGFAHQGGTVRFFVKDQKVQFEINHEVAKQQGLDVSSKLLRIATVVSSRKKG